MANYPIYRLVKGSTLTFTEMDDNLRWLSANMSASVVTITGSTYVAGNLNVSDGITGSLFGTSSWAAFSSYAVNAISASYVSGSGAIVTNLSSSNDANINGLTIGRGRSNINKNTVVGKDAFLLNTIGDNNVALGAGTLASSSTGDFNTSVGTEALQYNTIGSYNVAVGGWSMRNNTSGILNTVVGTAAMINSTTGNNNSVFGNSALYYNIGGNENSVFGYQAGFYNTSGIQNTAVGLYALYSNSVGNYNTSIGGFAGNTATSGSYNISIGYQSGLGNLTGSNNTIVGSRVTGLPVGLSNNIILADGQGNIRYRWDAIQNNISGGLNVTGGSITGSNALITGTLTAQTLVVQTITSSITYSSGSNIFGNKTTDTHQFTGSVLAPSITGSLFGTSSWAVSASWAPSNAVITSYIATGSVTASVSNTDISASFRVTSGSNTLLNVTRDGFVWIGNGTFTNQAYQLDVNGTARVSNELTVFKPLTASGTIATFYGYQVPYQLEASIEVGMQSSDAGVAVLGGSNVSPTLGGFLQTKNGQRAISFGNRGNVSIANGQISSSDYSTLTIGAPTSNLGIINTNHIGVQLSVVSKTIAFGGSASSPISRISFNNFASSSISTNVYVTTYTNASTVYIDDAPTAGSNVIFTNRYALFVNAGTSYFGGATMLSGAVAVNSTNVSTGYALFVNGIIGATGLTLTDELTIGENFAIKNNGSQTIDIDANNNSTNAFFRVTCNGTANELFRVNESGSFGIGTTTPNAKLDVSGSAIITGSLNVTQGITGSLFGTSSWSQNSITASNFNGTGSNGFVSNMSDTYTGTAKITDIVTLSSAEYAGIVSPSTSTLYIII